MSAENPLEKFLADTAADKRARLVESLLANDIAYAEHWLTFWNDLLRNDYSGTGFITGGRTQITKWLYRALAEAGASFLAIPAAFTQVTGEAHWHVLNRARAIENTSYVIAAAQGGTHENGRATYGHSIVVDPWGQIVAATNGTGFTDVGVAQNVLLNFSGIDIEA